MTLEDQVARIVAQAWGSSPEQAARAVIPMVLAYERAAVVAWLLHPNQQSVATMDPPWTAAYNAALSHAAKAIERGDHAA